MYKRILPLLLTLLLLTTTTASAAVLYPQAVILVKENDVLNVRKGPGAGYAIVERLDPHAANITLTGAAKTVNGSRWVQIKRSNGKLGWVNSRYLTEYVTPTDFCADERVNTLLADFDDALTRQDGVKFASLVKARHGLNVTYLRTGRTINYTPAKVRWLFTSTYVTNWGYDPASALLVKGSFHAEVLPKIMDVLNSEYTLTCNGPDNYDFYWPLDYANINYYTLFKPGTPGVDLDWRAWLVGVEYANGKPYLFSLFHLFWEP